MQKLYPDLEAFVVVISGSRRLWNEAGCGGFAVVDDLDAWQVGREVAGFNRDEWDFQYALVVDGMKGTLDAWPKGRKLEFIFVIALFDTPSSGSHFGV